MKGFLAVLQFELGNYFKAKVFVISTILVAVLSAGLMFLPKIIDMSGDDKSSGGSSNSSEKSEMDKILFYDAKGILDNDMLTEYFKDHMEVEVVDSIDKIKSEVEAENVVVGVSINDFNSYDYYVFNKSMEQDYSYVISEFLAFNIKTEFCKEKGIDFAEYMESSSPVIVGNEKVLGKDSTMNFWYCYIFEILVFVLIISYGMTIATSVTNEKSNRSIEVLVTSTSTVNLLFGKVIAGVMAVVFQVGIVAAALLGSYQVNIDAWDGKLDFLLNIPADVLITFAIFGVGGFIFYAFLYGVLGALVSKVEDLNKSAGAAQYLVMIVYFAVLLNLQNPDGIIIKVCSFLPFSSYGAMFARVAMGNVEMWEVVLSAVILYGSLILVGIIGGKIYRNTTLRYGNPIKLSSVIKNLKKTEKKS